MGQVFLFAAMVIFCCMGTEESFTRTGASDDQGGHIHVTPPPVMTPSGQHYFEDHFRLLGFVGFVSHLAMERDRAAEIAAQALYDTAEDDAEMERHKRVMDEGGVGALKKFRSYRQLLLQLVVSRGGDQFLTYVSELLAMIFRTRPETLRSNEQVRLDVVLQHNAMEDLVADLAERRVQALSYQGMRDLSAWLEERLGLKLFDRSDDLSRAVRVVELRNLIAHNRAVVNQVFLKRVPDHASPVGAIVKFKVDDVLDDLEFLARAVRDIEERAVSKFGLPADIKAEDLQY